MADVTTADQASSPVKPGTITLARHGEQSPQVTILHKWDLSHLQEAEPRHRLMAFCQDLLRLLLGQGAQQPPLQQLRAGQSVRQLLLCLYRKNGTPFWCDFSASWALDEQGDKTSLYVVVLNDVTEQKMAEDALRALPEADRLALFSAAHAALRSDPRAWLALWTGGPARQ